MPNDAPVRFKLTVAAEHTVVGVATAVPGVGGSVQGPAGTTSIPHAKTSAAEPTGVGGGLEAHTLLMLPVTALFSSGKILVPVG